MAHTAQYMSPNRQQKAELGMIGFVDDSNGQTNSFPSQELIETPLLVLAQMKENATLWSKL
jgi:hypothetical protein